jgi:Sigma-70, region 4
METMLMDESRRTIPQTRGRRQASARVQTDTLAEVTRSAATAPALTDGEVASDGTRDRSGADPADAQAADRYDPRDQRTLAQLKRRTSSGGYEVSEARLVHAIRGWRQRGESKVVRTLCGLLIERCMPEFQRRSWGLRHRPELMEDAIMGMIEQVLREAQDPSERFMTLNFVHYLRCCCADNFTRVLRQEGLSYRRDAQGRPAGRPLHVPAALVERIDIAAEDREDTASQGAVVVDPRDGLEERMAALEAQRILAYLPDPLDRQIMVLRVFEHMRWDDVARACGKTERTMRLRYEKALVKLRQAIELETAAVTR